MRSLTVPALAILLASVIPAVAMPTTAEAQQPSGTGEITSPQEVAAAVNQVQGFYNNSNTFRSPFEQKFWVKAYNQEKSSSGTVVFAKPGKMSWTYTSPAGNRVVSDGQKVRVYEQANKQMYEQPVQNTTSQHTAALSFLTGQGKLSDSFNFQLFAGERWQFPGGLVLSGTPKQPTPAYSKVFFYVDKATSQVRRVMVIDGQGNRNRFDFKEPHINEPVTEDVFKFDPPAGTAVIR